MGSWVYADNLCAVNQSVEVGEGGAMIFMQEKKGGTKTGLSLLLGDSRYIEKKLSECTRKNDEFNSLAKMTNSINCTKFRNN